MALCWWKKNKVWIWRAIDGVTRAPLGWEFGNRSDATAKKLIDRVDDGKCTFLTDDWAGFRRLLPRDRHFVGKDLTFPIESTNSDIRHWLARFVRRSKVTSRCVEMVNISLKIAHHLQDNLNLQGYLKPLLSSFS